MRQRPPKIGYCSSCMKNIPHLRQLPFGPIWLLDTMTLRVASLFRIGPWFCVQCDKRQMLLSTTRRSASTYSPGLEEEQSVESVGNYIHTNESLIMRRNRAKRYSQKYRDGVVERIISGTSTLSQIGLELSLTERDLVDWIADSLTRKQDRIDELTALLRSIQVAHVDQLRIDNDTTAELSDVEGTIEGVYRPR